VELFFTTTALFIITVAASIIFYKRIEMAQNIYEESKSKVQTITRGFTKQVNRLENEINIIKKEALDAQYIATNALQDTETSNETALKSLEMLKKLSKRVERTEEELVEVKKTLENISKKPRSIAGDTTEIEAPIPVQKEDVLEQLTDTELEALIMIEEMDEGTVPKVKKRIDKTREHTARTLKKLYDKGFVDRNTSSLPYRYYIRPEIRDILLQKKEEINIEA